jgi:hypothetical protein
MPIKEGYSKQILFSSFKTQQQTRRDYQADPRWRHTLDKDQTLGYLEVSTRPGFKPNVVSWLTN